MIASVDDGQSLAEFFSLNLWCQRSMLWMMSGNIAFSVYYVIMGLVTSPNAGNEFRLSNAEFMAGTNLVAVAAFSCYVISSAPLRRQCASAYGFRCGAGRRTARVHWTARMLSITAECCNYVAMYAISFAFNLYPNAGTHSTTRLDLTTPSGLTVFTLPGLVAAARSSINQMTNCICAWALHRCYRFGRPVEGIRTKVLSCALVAVGLWIGSSGGN